MNNNSVISPIRPRNKERPLKRLRRDTPTAANLPADILQRRPANTPFAKPALAPGQVSVVDIAAESAKQSPMPARSHGTKLLSEKFGRKRWAAAVAFLGITHGASWLHGNIQNHVDVNNNPNGNPKTAPTPSSLTIYPDQSVSTNKPGNIQLTREMSALETENHRLQQDLNLFKRETELLKTETLQLNEELLLLELEVSALKNAPTEQLDVKTVYNFVNVPLSAVTPYSTDQNSTSPNYNPNNSMAERLRKAAQQAYEITTT